MMSVHQPELTVLVPTYNPRMDYLARVLESLRAQSQPMDAWDLLVVDNNSNRPLASRLDLSWHPRGEVLVVPIPGKMHALAAAFGRTHSPLILILDDDTVAAPDLIEQTLRIAAAYPMLGTWSPRVELEIEDPAVSPPANLRHLLAERLVDRAVWSNDPGHVPSTAWGGGMAVRRVVADAYLAQTAENPARLQMDPMGDQLGYGGDTDLSYTGCSIGLGMGVFPQMRITHLIPKRRCTLEYLLRNLEAHEFSHQMQHFARHGELPRDGLRSRARQLAKWLASDATGRGMQSAQARGRALARRAIASGVDSRPVSHR